MILPILLVVLAGTISLGAALSAFILSRACGGPTFHALCCAAVTFAAALTLMLLALTFVENAVQDHYTRSRGPHSIAVAIVVDRNGEIVTSV